MKGEKMELRVDNYQLPEAISFNYDELKTSLIEKTEAYTKLVYTEDNIKAAKEDRADLNRLKKALNDERLRRQKEYMKPFDAFKSQIDEIISIIDKPVLAIDKQIREYEQIKQDEKRNNIEDMFNSMLFPEFVKIDQLWNAKWLNATYSMNNIEKELLEKKENIIKECQTLATLPSYSREAVHFYQKTLDIAQALAKVRELTEAEEAKKRMLEEEARRKEEEAKKKEEPQPVPELKAGEKAEPEPEPQMWVSFAAFINKTQAKALKEFFNNNHITFKPIEIKEAL